MTEAKKEVKKDSEDSEDSEDSDEPDTKKSNKKPVDKKSDAKTKADTKVEKKEFDPVVKFQVHLVYNDYDFLYTKHGKQVCILIGLIEQSL